MREPWPLPENCSDFTSPIAFTAPSSTALASWAGAAQGVNVSMTSASVSFFRMVSSLPMERADQPAPLWSTLADLRRFSPDAAFVKNGL
jgi:hypothetical protein